MSLTATYKQTRLDNKIGFFERDLEFREQEVYKRLLPEYPIAEGKLVPIETNEMRWAQSTSYKIIDGIGGFERGNDMTSNLPLVQMVGEEYNQGVCEYRSGYALSEDEIIASMELNIPIEEQKIALVQQAYVEKINRLILFGDAYERLPGLVNNPAWLYQRATVKLDGSNTNSRSILAQLNAGVQAGLNVTNKIMKYDTLLIAKRRYDYLISQQYLTDFNTISVLDYFLKNNPSIKNIEPLAELEGIGPAGEDLMIYMKRDPMFFKTRFTGALRPRPLFPTSAWNWYRGYDFKWNGLIIYRRFAALVMIGI